MALSIDNTGWNAMIDALTDLLDGGTVEIRSGSKPASPAAAASGTLLATLTFPSPSFADAASGSATVGTIASVTAANTGTAGHFRCKTSGGTARVDGDVGVTGSGADLELDSVSIASGQDVEITGGTWAKPA